MRFRDAPLLRRLRARDRAAFEEVVESHYASVYRQLWHLCGDSEDAADLTQETFVQAWQSLDSFAGRSSVRTWLYTIALRVWQRWRPRTHADETMPWDDDLAEELPDPAPDPAAQFERSALHDATVQALHQLSSPYRETLVLFYVQDMKYREIAVALDVPVGTVKSRLHVGVKLLKAELSDWKGEESDENPRVRTKVEATSES